MNKNIKKVIGWVGLVLLFPSLGGLYGMGLDGDFWGGFLSILFLVAVVMGTFGLLVLFSNLIDSD